MQLWNETLKRQKDPNFGSDSNQNVVQNVIDECGTASTEFRREFFIAVILLHAGRVYQSNKKKKKMINTTPILIL